MPDGTETAKPTRGGRIRARLADRRQRRAWRRERRKSDVNAYDATNQAESGLYKKGGFFKKD